jgi:signal peptide peptidase SppA
MSYARIIQKVFHSPWAIHQPMLGSILTVLGTRLAAEQAALTPADSADATAPAAQFGGGRSGQFRLDRLAVDRFGELVNWSDRAHRAGLAQARAGGSYAAAYESEIAAAPAGQTMVIFGSGILGKHLDSMEETCAGGLSVDKIQAALREARDDDKVASVILHLDTPGGIVYGIAETAALVRQIATTKPIVGFGDSQTASAGYWILAATDHIYVTPSADLGSIGVYSAFYDYSAMCAQKGIKVELFKDGIYKGAGFPGTSLTDEQRTLIQEEVNLCSADFKAAVRAHRAGVTDETMQGQCFFGKQAIAAKLADSLVNSLEEVVADLAATPRA